MKIYPIVEGHGDVAAVPILLRRLLLEAQCASLDVGRPIRRKQSQFHNRERVQDAVRLALLQPQCAAIVFLFDGEDSCPKTLAESVRFWARAVAGNVPCDVVVAYREYETWLLSAIESLRGKRGIRPDAVAPECPESRRDAKSALEEFMPPWRAYSETGDQPGMTSMFDMGLAYRRSRSFKKLVRVVGDIALQLRQKSSAWPPPRWVRGT